jgi:predicted ATPase/DNA-binding winged helix-turn-helix (wHTH) protein
MRMTRDETFTGAGNEVLAFGPFWLDPVRRVLLEAGKQVRLGSRPLEILLALVARPGETVSTDELFSRVWPNGGVESGTLRAHIAALRKTLGDGEAGIRYVENISGQGYRFAVPVTRLRQPPISSTPRTAVPNVPISGDSGSTAYRADNLPPPLTGMVGRAREVTMLAAQAPQRRFVTLTGPGGVGKTMVALGVAETLAPAYPQGVCFVDLALLTEPRLAASALASALGLGALPADPLPDILTFIARKSLLLVLDNCEHVVTVAASLVEKLLQSAPRVHVLATSREPLRAEGEFVHCLEPLAVPEGKEAMTADEALAVPAIRLFVKSAEANLDTFELRDTDVPPVMEICRRLDGNPLAIELAAAHVNLLGLKGLADSLDEGLHLLIRGRRTAVPRHQTLGATLDWSYERLPPLEQAILRRLAVFTGSFDLQSARAVAADETVDAAGVLEVLTHLAAKSLIVANVTPENAHYRLLNTSRAYGLKKLRDNRELAQTQLRHAQWQRSVAIRRMLPR